MGYNICNDKHNDNNNNTTVNIKQRHPVQYMKIALQNLQGSSLSLKTKGDAHPFLI